MPLQKIEQLAFNAGEIAPEMQGRLDLTKYGMGVGYAINFIAHVGGRAERRPGTEFIAEVKDHDVPPRIIDFVYNDVQAYVVELGEEYARFYMLGGQIRFVGETDPYEIATPWAAADVDRLQYVQRSDSMFLAGGARGYAAQQLTRNKHADWEIAPWQSDTGPWLDPNDTAITLTPSAVTGAITITASASLFNSGHAPNAGVSLGALFRLEEDNTSAYSMWETGKSYADNSIVRYGANVYQQVAGATKTSGAVAPVHLHDERYDGVSGASCLWRYLHSGYGVARVTGYTDATHVNATVLSRLPGTGAVKRWREGAFSDYRGHPIAVAFAGQRLYWLGTRTMPRSGWGSLVGAPFDFTPGDAADDPVFFTLEADDANPIRTAIGRGNRLYAMTSKRVYAISGTSGGPIKPDDIVAPAVASVGSNGVQPIDVDRAILFVDASGRKVQELGFQLDADEDAARDLNVLASHIARPGG